MPAAARFRVGECDCWALADGELTYPASLLLPPDGRVEEQVRVPYTAILIHTGSRRILIDTGAGPLGPGTVLRQPLPCSPCLQRRCRIADTYRCMRDLDVEAVARAARELLALRAWE